MNAQRLYLTNFTVIGTRYGHHMLLAVSDDINEQRHATFIAMNGMNKQININESFPKNKSIEHTLA